MDTNILVDASRGFPPAVEFVRRESATSGLLVSIVTVMELIEGCRNQAELVRVRRLIQRINVLPVDEATSRTAHSLMDTFFLSHGLAIPDALIGATAPRYGLPLYTRNVRHFHMIPSLTVIRPY